MARSARLEGQNAVADRALDILLTFTEDRPVITASDLQEAVGLSRSTVYRYIASLRAKGLLTEDLGGGFRLGPQILQMARIARKGNTVADLALPELRALSEDCGELVQILERVGDKNILLEVIEGRHRIGINYLRGHMLPAPAGAAAKVLLAFAPEDERESLIARMTLSAYTPNSITDPDRFRHEIEAVARKGYALNDEEIDEGIRAVAAPIAGRQTVRHVVSIVGPTFRLTDEALPRLISQVKDTAWKISQTIQAAGY